MPIFDENYEHGISLSILVWGPSTQRDSRLGNKRTQIRDQLIARGHNAMFSEELPSPPLEISQKTLEFAQVKASHLALILIQDSPGALGEMHDFCNHPDVAWKIFVAVPRAYKAGYPAKGALRLLEEANGGVFWYEESDLSKCTVATRMIRRADARRELEFIMKREA
ncbi:MAG: hypothetical protein MN733_10905 [Nitrososphaera sp.]|nr:hypothetical protein [Nitrososphaera sp.]